MMAKSQHNKSQDDGRLKPLSMGDVSIEDALKGAMEVPAPEPKKPKRKAKGKKRKKKAP